MGLGPFVGWRIARFMQKQLSKYSCASIVPPGTKCACTCADGERDAVHSLRSVSPEHNKCGCGCGVMSCHVMSCHVMSCHVMSCHVMSCHVMFLFCSVLSCPVLSCLVQCCAVLCCGQVCGEKTRSHVCDGSTERYLYSEMNHPLEIYLHHGVN